MSKKIRMEVKRRYFRDGVQYEPGTPKNPTVIEVDEAVAESMEQAHPPFGRRMKDAEPVGE